MRKVLIILFFISLLFGNLKLTFSFTLIGNTGSGFYTSIADTIDELEEQLYTIEYGGKNGTKERINSMTGVVGTGNCLKENLTKDEIKVIVASGSLTEIIDKIDDSCKVGSDKEYIPNTLVIGLVDAVNTIHNNTKISSQEKVSQALNIFALGSNGVYADGIEDNAPFDLIIDLKDIDNIAFSKLKDDEKRTENEDMFKEQKPYEKTNNFASSGALSGTLQELIETSKQVNTTGGYSGDSESWENYWKAPFKDTSEYPNKNVKDEEYKPIDDNKVWTLYSNTGAKEELKKIQYYSVNDNNQYKPIELAKNISGTYLSMDEKDEGGTGTYFTSKNGADKSVECKDSFCIDKTEMKYNFENEYFGGDDFFRGGQTRDMSIEDLIIRSNDHLQKFTNTSLVQAKMTINNFELGLKDIDLQEMFHLGFQIVKKPVPILDLTYETQKNNSGRLVNGSGANISEFELNKQLEFYYNIYGLDYNRRNDLSILTDVVYDKQMALNSTELSAIGTPNGYMSKFIGYSQYSKRLAEQREIFGEIIGNEATFGMLGNLERQFRELEIYHRTIKDYIVDLKSLIINLLKIPIDTSQT